MKYLMIAFFLLIMHVVAFSQQSRFIFLESEARQPFYVRMGDKSISSSSFGHLVIPGLGDSTYTFSIGFPRNKFPEQDFRIALTGKDRGFELKMVKGNQVNLYDWQQSETLVPLNPPAAAVTGGGNFIRRTDAYAVLMAGVVNDSLVLMAELPEAKKEPEVIASRESEQVKVKDSNAAPDPPVEGSAVSTGSETTPDSVAVAVVSGGNNGTRNIASGDITGSIAVSQEKADTSVAITIKEKENSPVSPSIILLNERTGPEKKTLYYLDGSGPAADTINVVIMKEPFDKEEDLATNSGSIQDTTDTVAAVTDTVEKEKPGIVLMNSDCTKFADDQDLDRLRISLLKQDDDDERILAAKKVFRTRCFSTKQVKALTELFNTEGAKYAFLDAAYPFVSDSGNFKSLVDLFSDPYYINRFKALVRM